MLPQTLSEALALKARFEEYLRSQKRADNLPFTEEELNFLGFPTEKTVETREVIRIIPVKEIQPSPEIYPPVLVEPLPWIQHPEFPGYPWRSPFVYFNTTCETN
jgi:hypothetical protein